MEMKIMYSQSFDRLFLRRYPTLPKTIPFDLLEPFRENIEDRHGQTLEKLNGRGGLSPGEIHMGINDISIKDISKFDGLIEIRGLSTILDLLEYDPPQP